MLLKSVRRATQDGDSGKKEKLKKPKNNGKFRSPLRGDCPTTHMGFNSIDYFTTHL